jgi:hypothetical protein
MRVIVSEMSNPHGLIEIASPPAFAEAPARRTRLRQAGLRAGRPDFSDFIGVLYVPIDIGMAMKSLTNRDIGMVSQ